MNYQKIVPHDFTNGEGHRVSLFVSGCVHNCAGCFNTAALKPNSGFTFSPETEDTLIKLLERHDGLSLLGGDPLHPRNRDDVLRLCVRANRTYPNKDIWLWTGYEMHEVPEEIKEVVNVIIDGRYKQDEPTTKAWRGSDNQRLWYRDSAMGTWSTTDADSTTVPA